MEKSGEGTERAAVSEHEFKGAEVYLQFSTARPKQRTQVLNVLAYHIWFIVTCLNP